ncbi:type I restriction-modification system subunit M N-terminal domain-containing protein [Methanospirillum purgamenti]|uniref:type I restriction-modification system subunit M N-terminal domain-containing protein n=1 Tax=Methanospirillum purgamenti TaxID=2834276 RepID=UPI003530049D
MRLAPDLKSDIDTLWDRFWSGGMSNPLQSIEQMSYLIFMKRLEDMDIVEERRANPEKFHTHQSFPGMKITGGQNGRTCQPKRCFPMSGMSSSHS